MPTMNVSASSPHGAITSVSVATPSSSAPTRNTICVARITRRRSTMSASEPASRPTTNAGAVLAVCTSATISADGVIVAISHAAIVDVIV